MKYYLLTFNKDHGDEHNVPALACFTESEYQKWLEFRMVVPVYEDFEEVHAKWTTKLAKQEAYNSKLNKFINSIGANAASDRVRLMAQFYQDNPRPEYVNRYNEPVEFRSILTAYLGNGSDGFEEGYESYKTGQEFVDAGIVKVIEVDESFFNYFHQAKLDKLSLCSIFDTGMLSEYALEEEYYDED